MYVIHRLDPQQDIKADDTDKLIWVCVDDRRPDLIWICTDPQEATKFTRKEALDFQLNHPNEPLEIIDEDDLDTYIPTWEVMGT